MIDPGAVFRGLSLVAVVGMTFPLGAGGVEPAARVRQVGDGVCTVGEIVTGVVLRVDFRLCPEPGSDIRCRIELPPAARWDGRTWHAYFPQFLRNRKLTRPTATLDDLYEFVRLYAPTYNACSDDLEAFRRRGGKLIVTPGLEDQTDPPRVQIAHFERVVSRLGGDLSAALSFYRVFPVRGCRASIRSICSVRPNAQGPGCKFRQQGS